MFDKYIEPVVRDYLNGEMPQIMISIHRQGTKEKDYLAQVRFKETSTVSLFRCDIYMEDVDRLCRDSRIYLQTEDIYPVIILWFVLHPLFQSQYNNFTSDLIKDYDAMIHGATDQTYNYIMDHYPMRSLFRRVVLDVLQYYTLNQNMPDPVLANKLSRAQKQYRTYCRERHKCAYSVSSLRRGHNCMVDSDGMILLERIQKKE